MEFWTGYGAVILSLIGGIMVVVGAYLSAHGQYLQGKKSEGLQKQIADLSRETLTSVVGSPDSVAVVYPLMGEGVPGVSGQDATKFFISNTSDYPLIAASLVMGNPTTSSNHATFHHQYLGDIYDASGGQVVNYIVPLRKDIDNVFEASIDSRSVKLFERIIVSWNEGKWEQDYCLMRLGIGGIEKKVIKSIREDFPYVEPESRKKYSNLE